MSSPTIEITFDASLDDVIEEMLRLDREAVFDFICALDLQCADYDFTKRLRDHFANEIKKCNAEARVLKKATAQVLA